MNERHGRQGMLRCYRDDHGFVRADAPAGKELLGSYFVQDVQGNAENCRSLLRWIADIQAGKRDNWEHTGNAHHVTVTQYGATIENLWDESLEICRVSI